MIYLYINPIFKHYSVVIPLQMILLLSYANFSNVLSSFFIRPLFKHYYQLIPLLNFKLLSIFPIFEHYPGMIPLQMILLLSYATFSNVLSSFFLRFNLNFFQYL